MTDSLTPIPSTGKQIQLHYAGSKGWLIFWLVLFFPVGLILLLTAGEFEVDGRKYFVRYNGSRKWLCFWTVFFFPITVILILLNGFSIHLGE
jgi:hypothetical protein